MILIFFLINNNKETSDLGNSIKKSLLQLYWKFFFYIISCSTFFKQVLSNFLM